MSTDNKCKYYLVDQWEGEAKKYWLGPFHGWCVTGPKFGDWLATEDQVLAEAYTWEPGRMLLKEFLEDEHEHR